MRLIKNFSIVLLSRIANKILIAISFSLIVRKVSNEEFGIISYLISAINILTTSYLNGINANLVQSLSSISEKNEKVKAFTNLFILSIFIGTIVIIFVFLISIIFNDFLLQYKFDEYKTPLIIGVFSMIGMNNILAFYQGIQDFSKLANLTITRSTITLILLVIFVFSFDNIFKPSMYLLVLSPLIIFIYFLIKDNSYLRIEKETFTNLFKNLKINYLYICYSITQTVSSEIPIFVLGTFSNLKEVAYYSVANKLYSIFLMVLYTLHTVLLPKFSSILDKNYLLNLYNKMIKYLLLLSIIFLPLFLLCAKCIVLIFGGIKYNNSILPLKILGISSIISLIFSPSINVLFALKKVKDILISSILLLLVITITSTIFSQYYGASGVAFSILISFASQNLYLYLKVRQLSNE